MTLERSYRQFQHGQVAEAARRDERLQFELDTMAGEGLEVVMVERPSDGVRQVYINNSSDLKLPSHMHGDFLSSLPTTKISFI